MKLLKTLALAPVLAGTIALAPAAEAAPVTCSHREGTFTADVLLRPNHYPTPDVILVGGGQGGRTIVFDHQAGSETWRRTDTGAVAAISIRSNSVRIYETDSDITVTCYAF